MSTEDTTRWGLQDAWWTRCARRRAEGRSTKDEVQRTKFEYRMSDASSDATPIAIAVVEFDGSVLVGKRGPDSPLADLWEFPGGKVESNESPESAAVRECSEETGLSVELVAPLGEHVQQYDHDCVRLYFFRCRPLPPIDAVRAPFRWILLSELALLPFPSGNRDVIAQLTLPSSRNSLRQPGHS